MTSPSPAVPRDRPRDRIACLVFALLTGAFGAVIHWLGAPRELLWATLAGAAVYAVAGAAGPLWWLRNVLLFQYRAH